MQSLKLVHNTIFLKCRFSLLFSSSSGLVPLHNACSYGHYEVAELLVRHGASVNVADLWKFTPLHEAAAKGKYEICKLLLKVRVHYYNLSQRSSKINLCLLATQTL